MSNIKKEDVDIQQIYGDSCILSPQEFIEKNNININGLDSSKSMESLHKYGTNEIKHSKPKKWYNYFFASLFSPFNTILLGITLVLVYTDIILTESPSPANIIVIAVLVLVSTLLEFFEVYRSNRAAEKLKELVATTTTVLRDGKKVNIPLKDVTIGDIIILSAGDLIPADSKVLESKDLYVGQSSITGESDAVRKVHISELKSKDDIDSITDLDTICFMGTNVISR